MQYNHFAGCPAARRVALDLDDPILEDAVQLRVATELHDAAQTVTSFSSLSASMTFSASADRSATGTRKLLSFDHVTVF